MKRNVLIPVGLVALVFVVWRGAFGCETSAPVWRHLALHAANVALLWGAVRLMIRSDPGFGALAAASLFAVHPALAEALCGRTLRPEVSLTIALAGTVVVAGGVSWTMRKERSAETTSGHPAVALCFAAAAYLGSSLSLAGVEPASWGGFPVFGVVGELLVMPWTATAYRDPPGAASTVHGVILLAATLVIGARGLVGGTPGRRGGLLALGSLATFAALLPLRGSAGASGLDGDATVAVAAFAVLLAGLLVIVRERSPAAAAAALGVLVLLGVYGADAQIDRWKTPESVLRHALDRAPGSAEARVRLGAVLCRRADAESPAAAAATLEEALVFLREASNANRPAANVLFRLGRFAEGIREFERVDAGPAGEDESVSYASALIAVGRLDDARGVLAGGLAVSPESVELRNLEATLTVIEARRELAAATTGEERAAARAEVERGIALYERILDAHPDHLKTRCDHVKAVIGADWLPDHPILTTRIVNDLVRDFPDDGYVKYLRARVLADADAEEAIRLLDQAITLDPLREEAYELLSHLLVGVGRVKEAKLALDEGLEAVPRSPRLEARMAELMIALARHHEASGAPHLALQAAERAAALAGHAVEPWLVIGEMMLERAQMPDVAAAERDDCWERSRHAYEKARAIEPGNADAAEGLAQYYRARGYGVLLTVGSATKGLEGAALAARKHELRRRAMFEFRRALDLVPGDASLASLVRAFTDDLARNVRRDLDEVPGPETLALARDIESLAPKDAESHVLVASVLQALGRWAEALDAWETALTLDPGHLRATWESARILFGEKRWKEAADRLERFIGLTKDAPDPAALEELAGAARDMLEQCRRRM